MFSILLIHCSYCSNEDLSITASISPLLALGVSMDPVRPCSQCPRVGNPCQHTPSTPHLTLVPSLPSTPHTPPTLLLSWLVMGRVFLSPLWALLPVPFVSPTSLLLLRSFTLFFPFANSPPKTHVLSILTPLGLLSRIWLPGVLFSDVTVQAPLHPPSPYFCCSILCVHCFRHNSSFYYLAPPAWSPRSRHFGSAQSQCPSSLHSVV
jgi:hypothetical protein